MRTVEIIHLRLAGKKPKTLVESIRKSFDSEPDVEVTEFYRRCGLDTDLAVHILHRKETGTGQPSDLGVRLASALQAYGLVEHTLWERLE